MTHEEANRKTKEALAASLKKFMTVKPLKKVTVTEIIGDCNLNRKTFYYHFEDIYALLKWMLEQEAIEVVKQFDLLIDYHDAIVFVMDYVEANTHMLNCAYDSLGREEMKKFFYRDFLEIIKTVIDGTERALQLHVSKDFKLFLCNFYTEALAGMLIEWIKNRTDKNRKRTIEYLNLIICVTIPEVLKKAPRR